MYRFWVQPWGGQWQIVQDWSPSATHTWRPAAPGGYNLTVYGRTGSGDGDVSTSRTFVATASGTGGGGGGSGGTSPLTSIALSYTPTTPQAVGTARRRSRPAARAAAGRGCIASGCSRGAAHWQIVQDWSPSATHTWRPGAPGGYNLTVYGRTGSGDGDVSDQQDVRRHDVRYRRERRRRRHESADRHRAVVHADDAAGRRHGGRRCRPAARAAAGRGCIASGCSRGAVQWQIVQDWSPSATHTWRPAAPGGYNLTVYGRTGSGDGDVSTSRTFVAR